jgi:hypothetical protein
MLWGAFVRQVPPSFVHYRREKTITLLGGPASSLIFGLVFTAIAVSSPGPIALAFFGKLGLMSFLGVLELIPRERNGIGSDGYRLWQVRRGGQALDDIQRESLAEASNFTPLRYRDWPHAVIVRLAGGDLYDTYLAYLHSLDAGNTEAASRHMGRLIAYLPEKDPNPHFAYEAAYWLALYGGDAEGARRWMKRAGQNVEPDLGRRAEAALALADRQPYLAEELAREGLAQKQRDLVKNALRMRPDRIIVGECRGAETVDMLQAMNTGHEGSLTTIHANSPREAVARLEVMVSMANSGMAMASIRQQIASSVHLFVQAARLSDGSRRVTAVTEVVGMEGSVVSLQDIFLFEKLGLTENNKVRGRFLATGIRPKFSDKLAGQGIDLPTGLFEEDLRV